MINLKVKLPGLELKNPVMPSSGPFHYGWKMAKHFDLNILGSIITKSVTLEPQKGNPTPYIANTQTGLINAIGLHNPGVKEVINTHYQKLSKVYSSKFIASIAGKTFDEYVELAKQISKVENVGALELNISCPNVENGMIFGADPIATKKLVSLVKNVSKVPVYVKLSPNVEDIVKIAIAAQAGGADGLSMINTVLGMVLDYKTGKPVISNKMGGVSGSAILPIAIRMVYQVSQKVNIPIIGIGGIKSAKDVIEMMSAGASAVAIGEAVWNDPKILKKIIEDLPKELEKINIDDINKIVGRAWK